MAQSFSGAIDAWVTATKERTEAVFRNSAEAVIEDVIDRTPVDTGFLRASLTASLDGLAPIRADAKPPADATKNSFAKPAAYSLTVEGASLGDTIYVAFVASYAAHVEYGARGRQGVGMVRLAAQKWPEHVANAVRAAKAAVSSR